MRAKVRSPIVTASNVPPACSGKHLPQGADKRFLVRMERKVSPIALSVPIAS